MNSLTVTSHVYIIDQHQNSGRLVDSIPLSDHFECQSFSSSRSFIQAEINRPACLILHPQSHLSGLSFLNGYHGSVGEIPVVAVVEDADISVAVQYLRGGARTVLPTPIDFEKLSDEIADATQQDREMELLRDEWREASDAFRSLTHRQRQVAEMMRVGTPARQIATDLEFSLRTIEQEKAAIISAFGVKNSFHLAVRLAELDIVQRMAAIR